MCAGSAFRGDPLFRGPEIPGRGGSQNRRGGEDAAGRQLRRLRFRRLPRHGRCAREAGRHFVALLSRGRRRLHEGRRGLPRQVRSRKGTAGRYRALRRNLREASPHQRFQRRQVVCRGFVALCGRNGLCVRLSGIRGLRRLLCFRRDPHESRNGASRSRSR